MEEKILTAEQITAYNNLNIPLGNRVILSLDGGGVKGIMTIQMLKKIEDIAGIPLYKFCDFLSGTSTGSIICGLIAFGKTAAEIESLYVKFVTNVFRKRGLLANRFINPPEYDKINYRHILKSILADTTLQDACSITNLDLMITSKDATGNEETFFTCFKTNGIWKGTYKDTLLRTVMEATMSAPTYFRPLERFLDGGITTYNNPSLAAIMEAVTYDGKGKYSTENVTMFSLGTGKTVVSVSPDQLANHHGIDAYFWLNYVMETSNQDASSMQVDMFRSGIMHGIDYRRFQISYDTVAIGKIIGLTHHNWDISHLHNGVANFLSELTNEDLKGIALDDVSKFELLKIIGTAMVEYIMVNNKFLRDLNETTNFSDELVTMFGNPNDIKAQFVNPEWIDATVPS